MDGVCLMSFRITTAGVCVRLAGGAVGTKGSAGRFGSNWENLHIILTLQFFLYVIQNNVQLTD